MSEFLLYRIYNKIPKQALKLLGIVLANSTDHALEKAKRGDWKSTACDMEREIDTENWIAVV